MKYKFFLILLTTFFLLTKTNVAQYMITNSSFNSGGSLAISNNINESILCSVAESFIGSSVNPDYQHRSGFWYIYQEVTGTDVSEDDLLPAFFKLEQNYPNPFNPTTTIQFAVPERSNVLIKIYDILGSEVATLVNEEMEAGWHKRNFDASSLSSGIYLFRMDAGSYVNTKKMILIK